MAELVGDSLWVRCSASTRRSIGAANEFADAARTIHRFCGKACGQAGVGRRGSACFGASRWIARVLSSEPMPMMALRPAIAEATSRRAIVVR